MSTSLKLVSSRAAVEPSAVAEMLRRGREMEAQGREIVRLVQGEPDFDTPPHIVEAAHRAAQDGRTHYVPSQGLPVLREAIAEDVARTKGISADPATNVMVTTGATLGIYLALLATTEPGDEVLIPDPTYGPFRSIIAVSGCVAKTVPSVNVDGHFRLTAEALEAAIGPRTRVLIVATPNNPTGDVLGRGELEAIAEIAGRHGLIVISDEVYDALMHDGNEHLSILATAPELRDQLILVQSFSKSYAMTGWRLGYTIAAPDIVAAMANINQFTGRMPTAFVQDAGVAALRGPQEPVLEMARAYSERRDLLMDRLQGARNLRFARPEGTFYLWVDASASGMDSWTLAQHLLDAGGVLTSPGATYGAQGDGFLRISYAADLETLERGADGISSAMEVAVDG